MLPLLSLSLSPKRRELRRILELNLSDQSISGQVPLFRARFDDAAFDARTDLYEADVEHAAAEALAVEGLTSTAKAGKKRAGAQARSSAHLVYQSRRADLRAGRVGAALRMLCERTLRRDAYLSGVQQP